MKQKNRAEKLERDRKMDANRRGNVNAKKARKAEQDDKNFDEDDYHETSMPFHMAIDSWDDDYHHYVGVMETLYNALESAVDNVRIAQGLGQIDEYRRYVAMAVTAKQRINEHRKSFKEQCGRAS